MERTLNLMLPYALSPPNFSALKMDALEDCEVVEDKQEYMIEFHPSWMSPLLNLKSPLRVNQDDKPIIPLARKLNFNE